VALAAANSGPARAEHALFAAAREVCAQSLTKRRQEIAARLRPTIMEKPDHRHCRLLRARRERPRGRRAAERGYQFPPSDSDEHVALPCEGGLVKATISRRKRAVLRSKAMGCDRDPRIRLASMALWP
jgi:hypothetical protein